MSVRHEVQCNVKSGILLFDEYNCILYIYIYTGEMKPDTEQMMKLE